VLLFLDRNNIIVTENCLLELSTLRAFFSQTNAFLIFISNILLLIFNTINLSFMQENIGDDNYNSLLYIFYSYSISETIDNQNKLVKITIKIDSEIRVLFYNIEIFENLNLKNIKKIDFKYFSKDCLIFFDE